MELPHQTNGARQMMLGTLVKGLLSVVLLLLTGMVGYYLVTQDRREEALERFFMTRVHSVDEKMTGNSETIAALMKEQRVIETRLATIQQQLQMVAARVDMTVNHLLSGTRCVPASETLP